MKEELLSCLPVDHPWRDRVQVIDTLPSTNTHAVLLAREGAPEGTVVIARQQTAGRGRLGRSFSSPRDAGLYLSVILRPDCYPQDLMHLTCAAAVAARNAVEAVSGTAPQIKWINDLVLGKRKLAGILTELGFTPEGKVSYGVLGIGINVRHRREDFPEPLRELACSIYSETGKEISLPKLGAELILQLHTMAGQLLSQKGQIMEQYRTHCVTLGKAVRVISPSTTREATALALDEDGGLVVEFPNGEQETVSSGEVSVRGLWDYI